MYNKDLIGTKVELSFPWCINILQRDLTNIKVCIGIELSKERKKNKRTVLQKVNSNILTLYVSSKLNMSGLIASYHHNLSSEGKEIVR